MSLISLSQVGKRFPETGEVVHPLDLEIPRGQFISFLGPSGCGKSTLLRLIAGLDSVDQGEIRRGVGSRVSFVFQEPSLLPWRNVLENVRLPLELVSSSTSSSNSETDEARARESLSRAGLSEAFQKMPHQLSGGMKMRVSLARALVTQPEVLLLDEPFSALDEVTRFRLQEDLRSLWLASRMTVVFVTHSMSEAAFLAERQIVFSNRPARVLADRRSSLPEKRNDQTRVSAEFANEVSELQNLFRGGRL